MADHPEIDEINHRFKPLFRYLRPGEGECPFVVDDNAAKQVAMSHHSVGRDATLVQIGRKWGLQLPPADLAVTIRYAPFVEGTTIIYDLMDETMQGKARPFVCDLAHHFARMYLLLPFQVEQTSIAVDGSGEKRKIEVSFLDARQEVIQAALPFELRIHDSTGKLLSSTFAASNRLGRFSFEVPPDSARIVVHSCLTGRDETLTL